MSCRSARLLWGIAAIGVFAIARDARGGDPPRLDRVEPAGVRIGERTEVTIRGKHLGDHPRLVTGFPAEILPAEGPSDDDSFRAVIVVEPGVPMAAVPIRVVNEDGISNSILLDLDELATVPEVEPNGRFDQAQTIATPIVVEGRVADNDVDYFKFSGVKGQHILIDARAARIGAGADPQIRLTTADRRFVGSSDDAPGLATDARLAVELPSDGDYLVEISDSKYQGIDNPTYRLAIGDLPAADEIYPLGGRRGETVGLELRGGTLAPEGSTPTVAAATLDSSENSTSLRLHDSSNPDAITSIRLPGPIDVGEFPEIREPADPDAPPVRVALPVTLNGRIDPAGDVDRFVIVAKSGTRLRATVHASDLGSALDGVLTLYDREGRQVAQGDDAPALEVPAPGQGLRPTGIAAPDPIVVFAIPDGEDSVELRIADLANRGGVGYGYRIVVEPAQPEFAVELETAEVHVPRGGSIAVPVALSRRDYDGPIRIESASSGGIEVVPSTIPAGSNSGVFGLRAPDDPPDGPSTIALIATGDGPDGPIFGSVGKQIVYARQAGIPVNLAYQMGLIVAEARPGPFGLDAPTEVVPVAQGLATSLPLTIRREAEAEAELKLAPLPLPDGFQIDDWTVESATVETTAQLTLKPDAPLGLATIGFRARRDDRDVASTWMAVEVVRPVAIENLPENLDAPSRRDDRVAGRPHSPTPLRRPGEGPARRASRRGFGRAGRGRPGPLGDRLEACRRR